MRFLIAPFLTIASLCGAFAQSPVLPGFPPGLFQNHEVSDAAPTCSAASAYLATQTGLSANQTAGYTAAICSLVANGFFPGGANPIVGLYFLNNANAANYKVNVITPGTFNLTEHGTCTLTTGVGVQGDASTCYEDTNFTPSTAGSAYTLNSSSIFICTLNARVSAAGAPVSIGGESNGSDYSYLSTFNPSLNTQGAINSAPPGGIGQEASVTSSQGLSLMFRSVSTVAVFVINGVRSDNISNSTSVTAAKLVILAFNANGTIGSFSPDQLAYAGFGGGFGTTVLGSIATVAVFRTIMQNMMVTIGTPNVC